VICLNLSVHVVFAAAVSPSAQIPHRLFPPQCSFPSPASFPRIGHIGRTVHSSLTAPLRSTASFAPTASSSLIDVVDCADADRDGGGGRRMFSSLCPSFALVFGLRLAAGCEDRARGVLGRGCNAPDQEVLVNRKRSFFLQQRIKLVWTCTTAFELSRIKPLLEHESCPGTLAIVLQRGAT